MSSVNTFWKQQTASFLLPDEHGACQTHNEKHNISISSEENVKTPLPNSSGVSFPLNMKSLLKNGELHWLCNAE